MEKEKLSNIEIKIINATLKYLKEKNNGLSIGIRQYAKDSFSIFVRDTETKTNLFWICYSGNGKSEEMTVYESRKHRGNYKKEYKEFLINEIPEIKDRIFSYPRI